jgi:hypothetical protein
MDMNMRVLKSKIRGLEAESAWIRRRINKTSGPRRNEYWQMKRELGLKTRAYLVAYGLLRGTSYEKIENKPIYTSALSLLVHDAILETLPAWRHGEWSLRRVQDLLQLPMAETPSPTEKDVPAASKESFRDLINRVSSGTVKRYLTRRA